MLPDEQRHKIADRAVSESRMGAAHCVIDMSRSDLGNSQTSRLVISANTTCSATSRITTSIHACLSRSTAQEKGPMDGSSIGPLGSV